MSELDRRDALRLLAVGGASAAVACTSARRGAGPEPVIATRPLGAPPWPTLDPFLFCVHHDDHYPAGDERLGPAASLAGRRLGNDFAGKDGWRMYHGRTVPGFPQHPHRGFETVTVVRRGLLDHSDSLGAAARYGGGDVQWLTAGAGILHAEMFPLLERAAPNPVELFQIWLNLPRADKFAPPHFSMLWRDVVPRQRIADGDGRAVDVTVVAGRLGAAVAPPPPPSSWAARPDSDVAIWTLRLAPGARFTLPAAAPDASRALYVFRGDRLRVGATVVAAGTMVELHAGLEAPLVAGGAEVEALLLQGRSIGEPVVAHGPFVMNSREEIQDAIADYQRTRFGGWPWPDDGHVHDRDEGRFARHADGRVERPA